MRISNKPRDIFTKKKSKKFPFLLLIGTLSVPAYYYIDKHNLDLSSISSYSLNFLENSYGDNTTSITETPSVSQEIDTGSLENVLDEAFIGLGVNTDKIVKSSSYVSDVPEMTRKSNTTEVINTNSESDEKQLELNHENSCKFSAAYRVVDYNLDLGSISKNISYGISKNNSKITSSYVCLDEEKMLMDDFKSFCYNKGLEGDLDCFRVLSKLSRDEKERKSYQKLYDY